MNYDRRFYRGSLRKKRRIRRGGNRKMQIEKKGITRMVVLYFVLTFTLGVLVGFMWSEVRSVEQFNKRMQSLEESIK